MSNEARERAYLQNEIQGDDLRAGGIGVMNYTDICECGNLLDVDSGRPYWSWSFCIPFTHIEICFWNWAKPDYVDECSECLIEKQRQHEDWISGSAAQVGYERGLEDGRRE